jgi:hypothetical protein
VLFATPYNELIGGTLDCPSVAVPGAPGIKGKSVRKEKNQKRRRPRMFKKECCREGKERGRIREGKR